MGRFSLCWAPGLLSGLGHGPVGEGAAWLLRPSLFMIWNYGCPLLPGVFSHLHHHHVQPLLTSLPRPAMAWRSVTVVLPCPLVLPWGAAEKTAWQMYLCVQRRQGPVLLQPLLAPTPPLLPRVGGRLSCRMCHGGFCPAVTVARRSRSPRLTCWITSDKNIHFEGKDPQPWGRERLPPALQGDGVCGESSE